MRRCGRPTSVISRDEDRWQSEAELDAGLSEIVRFLSQRAPFDLLARDELAEVAAQATIEFHLAGAVILSEDGGPVTFLRVIHSGSVDITHQGRLLDLLGPGDAFGHAAMLSGLPPGFEAQAAEDTLCYRIPVAVARPLLDRARARELQVGEVEAVQPVAKLLRSTAVTCKPSESIGTVAERMTAAGVSAAVVELEDGGIGIITDRDLRSRVLAVGRSGAVRVDTAMTAPAYVVGPDRLGGEVLYEMLERGIRHAPVVSERGRLIGVLEDGDLVAGQPRSWFGLRRSIDRARTIDALALAAAQLPAMMLALHHSNVAALELAPVLSALVDALTRRSLDLVSAGHSAEAVTGIVWVSVGSQARRELTPGSTRRGAFIHRADIAPPADWLAAAEAALGAACGVTGPIVARDATGWLRAADAGDELAVSVLADRRVLWGTPVAPLPVPAPGRHPALLAALAADAFTPSLPTGFDADGVLTHDGRHSRLNVRDGVIVPIAAIARWAAAAAEAGEGSTPERLRGAAEAGVLTGAQAQTLVEAFELALGLRIVHQLEQIAAGHAPDDLLDAAAMSPLTRGHLRELFHEVSAVARDLRPDQ
ncbi:MAG: putative nucleotidyltransferase substrate binding domain-containing protein [Solirubrobacteraceae bacterium]